MKTFEDYNLRTNPFRMTPAQKADEIIWAGFPEIRAKFEKRILRSLMTQNSSLVLNYGEYGSGKTHAARYFSKQDVLAEIAKKANRTMPLAITLNFPKGKQPVKDLYLQIIDKLNIDNLREAMRGSSVKDIVSQVSSGEYMEAIMNAVFNDEIPAAQIQSFLYNSSTTELRKLEPYGVRRTLSSENDYTEVLSTLFSVVTYEKKTYSAVIIWLDEFEDISILNTVNMASMNNFLRNLIDQTPNNLLLFLNLTQSAMMSLSELADYLTPAVEERIKDKIEFAIPDTSAFRVYLLDLLNSPIHRVCTREDFAPFAEDLVCKLMTDLKNKSLRRFNDAFSVLLENAMVDDVTDISVDYYESIKSDVIGWR